MVTGTTPAAWAGVVTVHVPSAPAMGPVLWAWSKSTRVSAGLPREGKTTRPGLLAGVPVVSRPSWLEVLAPQV